jgi:tagatose-1,6-bisphosphate aldolase
MINIACNEVKDILIDEAWNFGVHNELLMHSIHAYPAKFPAFIASKAFEYAKREGVEIKKAADVFCGCGTVALKLELMVLTSGVVI